MLLHPKYKDGTGNTHFNPVDFIRKSGRQLLWADRHHLQQTVHHWDPCTINNMWRVYSFSSTVLFSNKNNIFKSSIAFKAQDKDST